MSTLNAVRPTGNGPVVSLADINAKFEALLAQNNTLMEQNKALSSGQGTVMDLSANSAPAARPAESAKAPKVAPQKSSADVWTQGDAITISGEAKSKVSGAGTPCGFKAGKLCTRCNGPFNPVLHFALVVIGRMDGSTAAITETTWKEARFVAVTRDADYAGNVYFSGWGNKGVTVSPTSALQLLKDVSGKTDTPIAKALKAAWAAIPGGVKFSEPK